MPLDDLRIAAILDMIAQLTAGQLTVQGVPSEQGDGLDQITLAFNGLATHLAGQPRLSSASAEQLDAVLDVILSMAALDFTGRVEVSDEGTIVDTIATGLNMLNEELHDSTVSKVYVSNIIDSMSDALIVLAPDATVKTVNRPTQTLFGYPASELLGQSLRIVGFDEAFTQMLVAHVGDKGSFQYDEYMCRTKAGQNVPVAISAAPMLNQTGMLEGIVCVVRDIAERKQAEEVVRQQRLQEEIIQAQAATLAELSTPLFPITDHVMVMPLIGGVDSRRAQQILESMLHGIAASRAEILIIDITGVPVVDTQVANTLIRAAQAVQLLGGQVVLTGIRPEVAQTLVGLALELRHIITLGTLQSGIAYAMRHQGAIVG